MEEFKQKKERNEVEDAARVKEFEQNKKIIQAVLSPHMYRIAEEYIESGTPVPSASAITAALSEVFPNSFSSQSNSITPSTSTSSLLNMLLTVLVGREREAEPAPVSSDASLIQQLTTRLRPASVNNGSSDLLSTLLDVMRNSPTDRNPSESPRPVPAPAVQFPGPGPYGSPQPQVQAQGLPSRPPFYVQMPPYNGGNPPYPGMMPQAGRPPMQPPQNPPNNFFFGTRYPNYYPPYQ